MTGQEFIDKSDLCYYDTDAEAILYGFSYAKTKAYAAAQVAAKDAEIEGLKANLQGQVDARMRDRKSKKELSDMYIALKADKERTREGVATQVDRLHKLHNNSSTLSDDDCEWLRSIAKELNALLSPADGGEQWIGDMSNESFGQWLRILKKTGELTVREDGGAPFKIKSVDGLYTGADCINDTINDVIEWVSRHGGLEFLAPTDGDTVDETKDESGLLPCPFCGGKADFLTFELQAFKGFEIRCSNQSCNAYKHTAPMNYWPMPQLDRQKAKWNTRAGRGTGG